MTDMTLDAEAAGSGRRIEVGQETDQETDQEVATEEAGIELAHGAEAPAAVLQGW